jgi:hypothetical protein
MSPNDASQPISGLRDNPHPADRRVTAPAGRVPTEDLPPALRLGLADASSENPSRTRISGIMRSPCRRRGTINACVDTGPFTSPVQGSPTMEPALMGK